LTKATTTAEGALKVVGALSTLGNVIGVVGPLLGVAMDLFGIFGPGS